MGIDPDRAVLLESLRGIIQWVQEKDDSKAVALDRIVRELEVVAHAKGVEKLAEVMAERNAAWADLRRIVSIVTNPLQVSVSTVEDGQAQRDAELTERMTAASGEQP